MGAAVAIVSAVVVDAVAVDAAVAGTLTAFGAIAAVGATVGAIGAITGNKTLSMVGMGLGIVGGVGTLASATGLIDSSTPLFGSLATPLAGDAASTSQYAELASQATPTSETTNLVGPDAVPPSGEVTTPEPGAQVPESQAVTPTGQVNPDVTSPAGATTPPTDASSLINGTNPAAPQVVDPTDAALHQQAINQALDKAANIDPTTGQPATTVPTTGANAAPPTTGTSASVTPPGQAASPSAPVTGANTSVGAVTGNNYDATAGNAYGGSPAQEDTIASNFAATQPNAATGGTNPLSSIMNFAKNNQLVTYGILQAGGSFLQGLTNPMSPAQIGALNAQANANNAAANLTNIQASNVQAKLPTATRAAPGAGGGLINQG